MGNDFSYLLPNEGRKDRNTEVYLSLFCNVYRLEGDPIVSPEEPEAYSGRYNRAFLNALVGEGNYTVRSIQLDELSDVKVLDFVLKWIDADDTLSFAYMSDTKLTMLWLHDYPGWMAFCRPLGISIRPSSKIAKRVTVMTRLMYLWAKFDNPDDIKIGSVTPDEFSIYDVDEDVAVRFLDGANVISRELLEVMITNGSAGIDETFKGRGLGNPYEKTFINRAVDRAGTFSLRITTPDGLIKGDAICMPRNRIPGGYDVLYCTENIKTELKTEFIFALAEPHPSERRHEFSREVAAPPPVWTDDQSMSWLGEWLFPKDLLIESFRDFAEIVYSEIESGNYPKFFTDVFKLDDEHSTITQFQTQAVRWEAEGLGLEQSIFLQERIGQGAVNQLSKKRRWPVPCAMYVHVGTDSWLHMAGYVNAETGEHPWPFAKAQTPRGSVWYHEDTGRLIYNDLDFADLYDRHGGWDLDDSVKAHARMMDGKKVWVIVRSPNSMGEYDIKDYVEGTFAPTWTHADGSTTEFPEVSPDRPAYLEELDITYKKKSLSPSKQPPNVYTKKFVKDATEMAVRFKSVFGKRANADIVYFSTMGDYRRKQLAPIEAIVDACTQEQSEEALMLITADTEQVISEIRMADVPVDRTLWKQRIVRMYSGINYVYGDWSELTEMHDNLCDLYQQKYFQLAQRTVEAIDPDIHDLGLRYASGGKKLVEQYYRLQNELPRDDDESFSEFCHRVNAKLTALLDAVEPHVAYNLVLSMARYVYSHRRGPVFKDTPLFQSGASMYDPSVFNYYLEALAFYKVGAPEFTATASCPDCGPIEYHDRVEYQTHLIREACEQH